MKQLQFRALEQRSAPPVSQGAVRVDGETIKDANFRFVPGEHKVLEVGKRRVATHRALTARMRTGYSFLPDSAATASRSFFMVRSSAFK